MKYLMSAAMALALAAGGMAAHAQPDTGDHHGQDEGQHEHHHNTQNGQGGQSGQGGQNGHGGQNGQGGQNGHVQGQGQVNGQGGQNGAMQVPRHHWNGPVMGGQGQGQAQGGGGQGDHHWNGQGGDDHHVNGQGGDDHHWNGQGGGDHNDWNGQGGHHEAEDWRHRDNDHDNDWNHHESNGHGQWQGGLPGQHHELRARDHGRQWFNPNRFPREFHAERRFHVRPYVYPRGWYARTWYFGDFLPFGWYSSNYYIDWDYYGLPSPPIGCEWVRVGRDALLVDVWTGEVLSVEYGVFWW